jgi:hypothetical protein
VPSQKLAGQKALAIVQDRLPTVTRVRSSCGVVKEHERPICSVPVAIGVIQKRTSASSGIFVCNV